MTKSNQSFNRCPSHSTTPDQSLPGVFAALTSASLSSSQAEAQEHREGSAGVRQQGPEAGGPEAGPGRLCSVPGRAGVGHAARHVRFVRRGSRRSLMSHFLWFAETNGCSLEPMVLTDAFPKSSLHLNLRLLLQDDTRRVNGTIATNKTACLVSASSLTHFLTSFQHEDNCMDIREYVIALSVVCRPAKTLETMKLAFKVILFLICLKFNLISDQRRLLSAC